MLDPETKDKQWGGQTSVKIHVINDAWMTSRDYEMENKSVIFLQPIEKLFGL